jgi:hypothetical protein
MSTAPIVDRIRIIPRPAEFLDRNVGSSGELFFSRDSNSLRVYSGKDRGGFEVARADLQNITNTAFLAKALAAGVGSGNSGASISVSETAPQNPEAGNLWLNTTNGFLYVYINDGTSAQWIQPAVPPAPLPTLSAVALTGNYGDLSNKPSIPGIATAQTAGTVRPGIGLEITAEGVLNVTGEVALEVINGLQFQTGVLVNEFSIDGTLIDASTSTVPTESAVKTYVDTEIASVLDGSTFGNTVFSGYTTLQQTSEVLNSKVDATGVVEHDFSSGAIWVHTSIDANFTANFTNIPTTSNRSSSVVLVLVQGATPRVPSTIQINGVTQTVKYQGGTTPTGTANAVDLLSITMLRVGSTWTVLGSITSYE